MPKPDVTMMEPMQVTHKCLWCNRDMPRHELTEMKTASTDPNYAGYLVYYICKGLQWHNCVQHWGVNKF